MKISNFGSPALGANFLEFENSSHHLLCDLDSNIQSTIQSELFASNSKLYVIVTGRRRCEGIPDDTVTELYMKRDFLEVVEILCGDIIISCWQVHFKNSEEVPKLFCIA